MDQEEVERLLLSLLQLSPHLEAEVSSPGRQGPVCGWTSRFPLPACIASHFLNAIFACRPIQLLKVFKQLDSWGIVYLQDLGDLRLRKKLRHLFRALLIGEVRGSIVSLFLPVLCLHSLFSFLVLRIPLQICSGALWLLAAQNVVHADSMWPPDRVTLTPKIARRQLSRCTLEGTIFMRLAQVEGERGKGWRKVPAFKSSLAKFVKRCCKEVRPRVGASSLPPENQASAATAIEGEQQAGELSFIFDAGEAERKADEAVQRWREQQAVLEGSLPEARLPPEAPGHRPVSPEEAPAVSALSAVSFIQAMHQGDGDSGLSCKCLCHHVLYIVRDNAAKTECHVPNPVPGKM